ncbi:MAG: exopolysaccharide biosynthesis polyprenyl glycosylphosphotransferase [Spirulina sp. SIO3F2]|nr:exopolysaccharide biosynthesis polyprenyl glycosylphosphotransferase [Spirulina sp. SIO3F2]
MVVESEMPENQFKIRFVDKDAPIMQIPPRLTVVEAVAFKQQYQDLLAQSKIPTHIVLDFEATRFIDSSGIGALVNNLKTSQEQGLKLILRNVQSPVMAVFAMTGLDQVLTIEQTTFPTTHPQPVEATSVVPPETHPSVSSWVKRTIDIVGSLVGLGITGLLLLPITIAIKTDSPGPILFCQVRCGWLGRRFRIWKFRSMCTDAEKLKASIPNQAKGAFFKNENDPRITKVGRFLRRTSLDELPQFWNVLKGEMSLVGTRPPTPAEVEKYMIPQWQRLDVKPGMTGEWQVNGRSKVKDFEDVIKLDLLYQENWSLWYDIKLILKTIWIVFHKDSGAV